jgi:hypothetical protein
MQVINGKVHVNMNGPDGNSFSLISLADTLARQLSYPDKKRSELLDRMMGSSRYEDIVNGLLSEFGYMLVLHGHEDKRVSLEDEMKSNESESEWESPAPAPMWF